MPLRRWPSPTRPHDARPAAKKARWPAINAIGTGDILDAIEAGLRDFKAAPKYGLFFGFVYAVAGWGIIALLTQFQSAVSRLSAGDRLCAGRAVCSRWPL